MSTYILRELERALGRLARRRDVIERIGRKPEMTLDPPTAQLVREAREARTEELCYDASTSSVAILTKLTLIASDPRARAPGSQQAV